MTVHPKTLTDLTLAPVAAEIDLNLQRVRDLTTADEILGELALELNENEGSTREERAAQIVKIAVRGVELHGWQAEVTDDASRIHLSGGSVTLDLGLSTALQRYIDG